MLTAKQLKDIREELENCTKPLYFFHDDPDGVCSFLQLYAHLKEGYGVIVKSRPLVDLKFLNKVRTYDPDKIFIVDIAMLEQDFVDEARRPIIWIDHHPPQDIERVKYFNPRYRSPDKNFCVAYLTYKAVKQNLWVAMVGCIGDMHWPDDLVKEFRKKYPDLLPKEIKDPRTALYESPIGKLAQVFAAILKGTSSDAMKYVKALTRIKEPYEILDQQNARGRFIYKRFKEIDEQYQKLLKEAEKHVTDDIILQFIYPDDKIAFSGDLANEMIYRHPEKIVLIGREKDGEYKCSLRSTEITVRDKLEKSLIGLQGYGGGHELASGLCIKTEDFGEFMRRFREQL